MYNDYLIAFAVLTVFGILTTFGALRAVRMNKLNGRNDWRHIFLDLETLSVKHDAPVLVIAAYVTDSTGAPVALKQWHVTQESAAQYGVADPGTVAWWSDQDEDAKFEAFERGPRVHLFDALRGLNDLVREYNSDTTLVWGNAPSFDCAILRHAFEQADMRVPWAHWQEADCRTIAWLGAFIGNDLKATLPFEGTKHVALHDARHQARYTMGIIRYIRGY